MRSAEIIIRKPQFKRVSIDPLRRSKFRQHGWLYRKRLKFRPPWVVLSQTTIYRFTFCAFDAVARRCRWPFCRNRGQPCDLHQLSCCPRAYLAPIAPHQVERVRCKRDGAEPTMRDLSPHLCTCFADLFHRLEQVNR